MTKEKFILEMNNILKEKNIDDKLIDIKQYSDGAINKSNADHSFFYYIDFYFEKFIISKIPGTIEQGAEEFIDYLIEKIDEK